GFVAFVRVRVALARVQVALAGDFVVFLRALVALTRLQVVLARVQVALWAGRTPFGARRLPVLPARWTSPASEWPVRAYRPPAARAPWCAEVRPPPAFQRPPAGGSPLHDFFVESTNTALRRRSHRSTISTHDLFCSGLQKS